ncbi:MAG TPA: YraN family protein [Patescibacteria group bacterium]|jgi:uncharacterized protein (TIGR00252 family)|nr:YraN family protein [Patescibacteria group bacterium]
MSTAIGKQAEAAVVKYLRSHRHKIIEQNWRTRWCEIDIISSEGNSIYFTEVKYRDNDHYGSGLDYITPRKLKQMHLAAEFWLNHKTKTDVDYHLSAAEVSGPDFRVTTWLPDC